VNTYNYEGLFEAHITVDSSVGFKEVAHKLNIKPILIQLDNGANPTQPMSSSTHKGTLGKVYNEVMDLANKLSKHNFKVLRVKIEASPFNQEIPQTTTEALNHCPTNYFEHHALLVLNDRQCMDSINKVCRDYNAHLSQNRFKVFTEGCLKFLTIRNYKLGRNEAEYMFSELLQSLDNINTKVKNSITEYCVYDSGIQLDYGWLN